MKPGKKRLTAYAVKVLSPPPKQWVVTILVMEDGVAPKGMNSELLTEQEAKDMEAALSEKFV